MVSQRWGGGNTARPRIFILTLRKTRRCHRVNLHCQADCYANWSEFPGIASHLHTCTGRPVSLIDRLRYVAVGCVNTQPATEVNSCFYLIIYLYMWHPDIACMPDNSTPHHLQVASSPFFDNNQQCHWMMNNYGTLDSWQVIIFIIHNNNTFHTVVSFENRK